jgi:hypothetical protein
MPPKAKSNLNKSNLANEINKQFEKIAKNITIENLSTEDSKKSETSTYIFFEFKRFKK